MAPQAIEYTDLIKRSLKCPCGSDYYIKRGYYRPRSNNYQPIPRYECKLCGRTFSRKTESASYRQHKPQLNNQVWQWYCSGTTQRRMAKVIGVNRKTIVRKFLFMAKLAREEHMRRINSGHIKTTYVQFDEMETYEHTKLKPLSIALAVRVKTGEIIDAKVASMNCHGHMANASRKKYGWREDNRNVACQDVLNIVKKCAKTELTVATDAKRAYITYIRNILPEAAHIQIKGRNDKNNGKKIFTLNYTCAKIRNDLSRMARKTWVTTKTMWALQAHLDLYIAFNNGYNLGYD